MPWNPPHPATVLTGRGAGAGTGKTTMLSLAALQMVDVQSREVQCLVLNPTRELANQTQKVPPPTPRRCNPAPSPFSAALLACFPRAGRIKCAALGAMR